MILKPLLSVLACLVSYTISAQYVSDVDEESDALGFINQSYIGLNVGFSNPSGDYGSDSRSNENAAFAKAGYHISLTYHKLFLENIGLAVLIGRSSHEMNHEKLESIFQEAFPTNRNPPFNSLNWKVNAGFYSTNSILAGLIVALPMENGFIDIRFLLGYASSTSPEISIAVDDGNALEEQIQKSSTKTSLAANIGAGIRLNLNHNLSLALNVDWYRTDPIFDQIIESNFGFTSFDTYTLSMTMLNPSIGIGYRFY